MRGRPWAAIVVAATLTATPAAAMQQMIFADSVVSPTLRALAESVTEGDGAAAESFWTAVARDGAPLVEEHEGVPGHSLVTFVYRDPAEEAPVALMAALASLDPEAAAVSRVRIPLDRLDGTDVHFRTVSLRNDARIPYHFRAAGDEAPEILDPLNPHVWEPEQSSLAASILELPGAPAQPWRDAGAEAGDWDELSLTDGSGRERTVYVYKPLGWDSQAEESYPALVGIGAFGIGIGMRVDWMADVLVARGALRPMVFVLVDLTNDGEPSLYTSTETFVADVVLPYVREHYGVSDRPGDIALAGTSRRGMVASLLALRRPDLFGNVISLSGSYYWKPDRSPEWMWLAGEYARAERRPVRFYVAAGELETFVNSGNRGHYMVGTNRHFRDVLRAHRYDITYVEFNGVHSELNWQDGLADGLVRLFGPRARYHRSPTRASTRSR